MKTDYQIQKDVMDQLKWEPLLHASEIGVAVKDGIVTLSGIVDSYFKKTSAENAAKRVAGVRAIAEDIQIGVSPSFRKTDTEIAQSALSALALHTSIPEERIKISVENGIVKLEGQVDWEYQRNGAKVAIENLAGVRTVINLITLKPQAAAPDIEKKIRSAFVRSATIDAEKITAEVVGSKVILRGKVRSFAEKDDAQAAAWAAPGIVSVENKLQIEEPEYEYDV